MTPAEVSEVFTKDTLAQLFPAAKADDFFEALYGDVSEGAYDISLEYSSFRDNCLVLEFHLKQRPGKCLACNLTHGLPTVFSRHPIINLNGITEQINTLLGEGISCTGWEIGNTQEISNRLHILPVTFQLA